MPSPFPGMDPYLESPDIWPDFHDAFAGEIRAVLNSTLPRPYYARLEMRPEVGIMDEGSQPRRRIVPDVAVARPPQRQARKGATAVLDAPRQEVSPSSTVTVESEPLRHAFVEIRDVNRGHHLITLIEIVSPSNKLAGVDRVAYQQKQREVLQSDANLIEVDLLRTGERLLPNPNLAEHIAALSPQPNCLVLVNRAWQRSSQVADYQIFSIFLREKLPCISVPLRPGEEIPLDLQLVFDRAYDSGPYQRGAVNYEEPPKPALAKADAAWATQLIQIASSASEIT